ncbi:MAG: cyclodehydratase [Mycobacteriaceae bacterium]
MNTLVATPAGGVATVAAPTAATNPRRCPRLNLAITPLVRSDGDVQLGWDPDRAVLIRPPRGVTGGDLAALLKRADGTASSAALADAGEAIRLDRRELSDLLDELAEHGLLSWAGPPQLVDRPAVHVRGRGPLSDAICGALALGGVQPTRSTGRMSIRRGRPPLLVVLADDLVVDPCLVAELVGARIAHLSVRLRDGVGMVGPLVLPGRTSCLRCADLHRADHDAEWPLLAAQLLGRVGHGSAAAVRATAGIALGQIELLCDGHTLGGPPPRTLDATIEVDHHRARLRRRVWSAHPRCGCGAHR